MSPDLTIWVRWQVVVRGIDAGAADSRLLKGEGVVQIWVYGSHSRGGHVVSSAARLWNSTPVTRLQISHLLHTFFFFSFFNRTQILNNSNTTIKQTDNE